MAADKSIKEQLYAYLRRHDHGVPARTLVEEVLHLAGAPDAMCRKLVESAVDGDPQFTVDEHGFWRVGALDLAGQTLSTARFTCVQVQRAQTTLGDDAVVDVAAARLQDGRVVDTLHIRVKPAAPLSTEGTRLTGLRDSDLSAGRRLPTAIKRLRRFGERSVWVATDAAKLMALFEAYADHIDKPITEPDLCLAKLTAKLLPDARVASIQDLAAAFDLPCPEHRQAQPDLAIVTDAFAHMLDMLAEKGVRTVSQALDFQEVKRDEVDFSAYSFDREFLSSLPTAPGVYIMKDAAGTVIYVGKARDLRARVRTYFAASADRDPKTQGILDAMRDVEIEQTPTELEALVREAELIHEHTPRFNTQTQVHERQAPYAKGNDLILLCPSADGVDVLFTARGELLERRTLHESDLDATELEATVRGHYFASRPAKQPATDRAREIVASWIEAHRKRAITLDVRLCEGAEHVAQLVVEYAIDVLSGEPRAYRI